MKASTRSARRTWWSFRLPPPRSRRADLPAELEAVILKALQKDRANRYMDPAALAQAHDAPTRTGAEADSAHTKALAGDILAGTGIAAAGVGLILLLTQTSLVAAGRVDIHRGLGIAGFFLACLMIVLGVLAATEALSRPNSLSDRS